MYVFDGKKLNFHFPTFRYSWGPATGQEGHDGMGVLHLNNDNDGNMIRVSHSAPLLGGAA